MWVAIVGSRTLGKCNCPKGQEYHPETCPLLVEYLRMLNIVTRFATRYPDLEGIVSGEANGADTLAKQAALTLGVPYKGYPVKPGKEPFAVRAKRRNSQIVAKADRLVAVYAPGPRTHGTTDSLSKAMAKGIPVDVFHEGKWLKE